MNQVKKLLFAVTICVTLIVSLGIASPVAAQNYHVHLVQPGDTVWKIAQQYQMGIQQLLAINPQINNANLIYPGQRIKITQAQHNEQQFENRVVELTNLERMKHGLKPLTINGDLARVAAIKSKDMLSNNYFAHQSPTYGSPFDMMSYFGINYSYAGENIAAGQRSPEEVVQAWMNSPGHRANILNPNYTQIGVGFAKGGSYQYYWTQMFISQ